MRITHFLKNYGLRFRVQTGRSGFLPASEMLSSRSLKPALPARLLHASVPCQLLCGAFAPRAWDARGHAADEESSRGFSCKSIPTRSRQTHLHPASRGHPTGEQSWKHCSPLHPSPPPACTSGFLSGQCSYTGPATVSASSPRRSARSWGPALPSLSRLGDSGRSGPRRASRWSGATAGHARPGRQGARWPAPPTPSARPDRVRHIGCRSRRGQRFLLCLRCALQVCAA